MSSGRIDSSRTDRSNPTAAARNYRSTAGLASETFFVLDPAEYRSTSDDPLAISIQRPSLEEPTFAALSEHLNLSQAMAKLLGGQVELYTDQIGIKHGWDQTEQGGRSYFHQDSWY